MVKLKFVKMEKSKFDLKENLVCYECKKQKMIYFEVFRLVSIRENKRVYMKQLLCEECLNEQRKYFK